MLSERNGEVERTLARADDRDVMVPALLWWKTPALATEPRL